MTMEIQFDSGWPKVALGECCIINPKLNVRGDLVADTPVTFLPMASVSESGSIIAQEERPFGAVCKGYTYFEEGDVLLAKITPCMENGKATIAQGLIHPVGFGSTEFHVLRPGKHIDGRYLFYMIWNRNFRQNAERNMTGTAGQKRVPAEFLRSYQINLPPLHEQKRIAAILNKADALRRKRQEAIRLSEEFLRSVFLDMFGDPVTNPNRWEVQALASLVRNDDSLNYGVVQPGEHVADGIPLIRVGDMSNGKVKTSGLKKIAPEIESQYSRSRLYGGEILVSCVGSIGNVVVTDKSVEGFNVARAVARIPLNDRVNATYVGEYLRTDMVQRYFTRELRTVSQPTLNIKQISETLVQIPPYHMQHNFAQRVKEFESMQNHCANALLECDNLNSALNYMFL